MNKIHLSHEAQRDLEEIKHYISKDLENPSAAVNTAKKITQTVRILQMYAEAGSLLSSIADVDDTYRILASGNYLILWLSLLLSQIFLGISGVWQACPNE